jgi:DNA-binding CsgD family transcriptional regulator
MDHFDLVQWFLEQRERGKPIEALVTDFQRAVECLGISNFACGSHVDPANPPQGTFMHHNYPRRWLEAFSHSRLHEVDPVFAYAEQHKAQFCWSDLGFLAQLQPNHRIIIAAAGTLGIRHGFTVPLQRRGDHGELPASCSFVFDSNATDKRSCFSAQLLATSFYEAAGEPLNPGRSLRARIRLSLPQRECLELALFGMTDWRIGEILRISESAVQTHIRHAMRHLQVPTREQAVAHALALGLIRFGDMHRRDETNESRIAHEAAYWLMLLEDDVKLDRTAHADYARWLAESAAHAKAMEFLRWVCNPLSGNTDLLSRRRWRMH